MSAPCVLVVPPDSALAKFAGQKVKIATVLNVVMRGTVDADDKKQQDREKCKAYYEKRKEEGKIARARYLAARGGV